MVDYFPLLMFLIVITTLICTAVILLKYIELIKSINLKKNKNFTDENRVITVVSPVVVNSKNENHKERSQTIDVECEIINETPKLSRYLLK